MVEDIIKIIKLIPYGSVATYGQVAAYAGNPKASRTVSMVLKGHSNKESLPWHRVINGRGKISLPEGGGFEEQKAILESEGIVFDANDKIDLSKFQWNPEVIKENLL